MPRYMMSSDPDNIRRPVGPCTHLDDAHPNPLFQPSHRSGMCWAHYLIYRKTLLPDQKDKRPSIVIVTFILVRCLQEFSWSLIIDINILLIYSTVRGARRRNIELAILD